jgi:hypothetical protein
MFWMLVILHNKTQEILDCLKNYESILRCKMKKVGGRGIIGVIDLHTSKARFELKVVLYSTFGE